MAFKRGHEWALKSRTEGMERAKKFHVCLKCRHNQDKIYKNCPNCGSPERQYFMSHAELKRGMMLLTLQAAGTISRLRFQPGFDLVVNTKKVGKYTADADYYRDGVYVVEDTKPINFIDKAALLKIKIFEALYGITVTIPQRASGNRLKGRPEKSLETFAKENTNG